MLLWFFGTSFFQLPRSSGPSSSAVMTWQIGLKSSANGGFLSRTVRLKTNFSSSYFTEKQHPVFMLLWIPADPCIDTPLLALDLWIISSLSVWETIWFPWWSTLLLQTCMTQGSRRRAWSDQIKKEKHPYSIAFQTGCWSASCLFSQSPVLLNCLIYCLQSHYKWLISKIKLDISHFHPLMAALFSMRQNQASRPV